MGDFHQNGVVSTLHDFGTKSIDDMEAELKVFSGYRPMELILPSLYSELEGPAPVSYTHLTLPTKALV